MRNAWSRTVLIAAFLGIALGAILPAPGAQTPVPTKAGATFADCKDCPEMVVIAAGEFDMGSSQEERAREGVPELFGNREQPVHHVTVRKPFALGRTEVTRGMYAKFSDETHRPVEEDCINYDRDKDNWALKRGSWRDPGFKQTDKDPAVCLSMADGKAYTSWLTKKTGHHYRLPSEAEWEYAARGGTKTARYWGDSPRTLCENANVMSSATLADLGWPESWQDKLICSGRHAWTVPVGSFDPNPFGLNDMYGGVWEWVSDCAHPDYNGAPTDGSAWMTPGCDKFLVRGGAFHSEFWLARSATRGAGLPATSRPVASGIRVARDLE